MTSTYIILKLYPKYKKILCVCIICIAVPMITLISEYRDNSFDSPIKESEKELNAYLGGIYNISVAVDMRKTFYNEINMSNFIYDTLRPVIFLGSILGKNMNSKLTVELFNMEFFGHGNNKSQIVPIIGQGYFYFGFLGAWILEGFALIFALKLEQFFMKTENLEYKFFTLYILLRLALMQGLSFTIIINNISYKFVLPMLLIWINSKIVGIKKENIEG